MKEKLQKNAEQHTALVNEKEELLKSIENVNRQLKETEADAAKRKREYMTDLQRQVSSSKFFCFYNSMIVDDVLFLLFKQIDAFIRLFLRISNVLHPIFATCTTCCTSPD